MPDEACLQTCLDCAIAEVHHTREAFETLVESQLNTLFRVARRLVHEREDAEDLVQETCLKAFRALHQFQPGSDCKAWLITILINTYRDWARKSMKKPRPVSFEDFAGFYSHLQQEHAQSRAQDPEEITVQANMEYLVHMAIEDLPPEFRLAVLLANVEGYSYREIAEIVDCPIGTVMSRLYRGRQLLRTTLRAFVES